MSGSNLMRRKWIMAKSIAYVGLDVHSEAVTVALAEAGLWGEARELALSDRPRTLPRSPGP